MKDGQNLEWETSTVSANPNLNWYQSSTLNTTNINILYLAPAPQKE